MIRLGPQPCELKVHCVYMKRRGRSVFHLSRSIEDPQNTIRHRGNAKRTQTHTIEHKCILVVTEKSREREMEQWQGVGGVGVRAVLVIPIQGGNLITRGEGNSN